MLHSLPNTTAAQGRRIRRSRSSRSTRKNATRARSDDYLVLVGICTHLGCLPKPRFEPGQAELGADWPGGFFCPCHGSRFDLAGRVFQGSPASLNLRIPPYSFEGDSKLVIGVDASQQGSRVMAGCNDALPVRTGFMGWLNKRLPVDEFIERPAHRLLRAEELQLLVLLRRAVAGGAGAAARHRHLPHHVLQGG